MIMLSRQQRAVCQALRSNSRNGETPLIELFESINLDEAFYLASANEVASTLALTWAHHHGWDAVPTSWRAEYETINNRIYSYLQELDHIAILFDSKNIRVVALKNAGIARGIFPHPGACPMGDIDVLVSRPDFSMAHNVLISQGYNFEFRSALEKAELTVAEQSGGTEYWKILPNGEKMWLELQWRPVSGRWIRPEQEPPAADLMARSIELEGTHVRLLAPEDNLLQVCVHTAKHSYVRAPGLRLHLDVERIVNAYPDLDWSIFLRRVKQLQVKTAVYFSLAIPKELFETPVPDDVLDKLRPPAWKEALMARWLQRAGLFNPDEKKFGRLGYILFTALLYDNFSGLLRGVFPDYQWMQSHYGLKSGWQLPYYYVRRLGDLLFRRLAT